ncbi:protection of telomeres protein 1 isoform X2 [Vanacampus margaritifer]
MPVIVLADGAEPGGHLTIIPIAHISIDSDHSHHSIKGRVVHKGPLVSSPIYHFFLKAAIEENCGPQETSSINMVLLGTLANDFSQAVNQGDAVTASGFTVGKSPTARKDKRHLFNLLLSGEQAVIRVSPRPPGDLPTPREARTTKALPPPAAVSSAQKYTYVKLADLKPGVVVNVYGVVVFFKQPFKSRGSDMCSSLKITDQSEQKISCTIFCPKMESHPQIFQIGDIVRLHKVKTQPYKDSLTLVTTFGFNAATFSGMAGADMEPRSSSRTFSLSEEDRRMVTELRSWVASQNLLPPDLTVALSAAQPKMYFDLTCQLLAKAPVDSTCTLLRVWDGTRCPHALLKVRVDSNIVEGPTSFSEEHDKLIANVLVYDNHVRSARQLKPGDFLRIFNLRAIPGSVKVPGLSSSQVEEVNHLSFHLHGGTAYGRGIRVLPDNSPDVHELRRTMDIFHESNQEKHPEVNDSAMWGVWNTPPESPVSGASMEISTERRCDHDVRPINLGELMCCEPGGVHHVRAQLRSYQPRRLHRALKLYCSKCTSMQDVPDDERVANVYAEASAGPSGPTSPPPWSLSGPVHLAAGPAGHTLNVHLSKQLTSEGRTKELIFLTGCSLQDARHLAATYHNVVPVRWSRGGDLVLLDLSVPFLFRGRKSFYGCKQCSEGAGVREPTADGEKIMDEKDIAEAFGVQLMTFVLLLKFRLRDAGDTLDDVFLWRDAETFFGVSAEDAAVNQQAQDQIRQTLDSLCPPEGAGGDRPWLDLCLAAYNVIESNNIENTPTFYQICHTSTRSHKHLQR